MAGTRSRTTTAPVSIAITILPANGTQSSHIDFDPLPECRKNPFIPCRPTLGTRFRSDVGGTVTALRWYTFGRQFTGETASGWHQANRSSPIAIAASTTYVVAYFKPTGFADDANFFMTGVANAPLHALTNRVEPTIAPRTISELTGLGVPHTMLPPSHSMSRSFISIALVT